MFNINKFFIILFSVLVSFIANAQEQHLAEIVPAGGGTFAQLDAIYLRGGWREVTRITERDSITYDRQRIGMVVYVANTDSCYKLLLKSFSLNYSNWMPFKLGSVDLSNYYNKTQSDLRYLQGSGTNNYLPIFNSSGQLQNSTVTDDGTDIYFNYRGIRGNQIYGNFFATNASYGGVNDSGIAVIKTNGNIAIQKPYTFIKRYTDLYGYQPALGFIPENVVNKSTSLSPNDNVTYPTTAAVNTGLNAKYNLADTLNKWIALGWLSAIMKYTDTAAAFAAYRTQINTNTANIATNTTNIATNTSNIGLKLNITDTTGKWLAQGWLTYLMKYTDTASALNPYRVWLNSLQASVTNATNITSGTLNKQRIDTTAKYEWTGIHQHDSSVVIKMTVPTQTWQTQDGNSATIQRTTANNALKISNQVLGQGGPGNCVNGSPRLQIPTTGLNISSNSFSFSLWFKPTSFLSNNPYNDGIIGFGYSTYSGNTDNGTFGVMLSNNALNLRMAGSTSGNLSTISANTWYHLAGVVNGSTVQLYLNGTPLTSQTISTTNSVSYIYLGYNNQYDQQFRGYIDQIAFWNGQLTSTEVGNIYNSAAGTYNMPSTTATLKRLYQLDEGSGTNLTDLINNVSGTLNAGSWAGLGNGKVPTSATLGTVYPIAISDGINASEKYLLNVGDNQGQTKVEGLVVNITQNGINKINVTNNGVVMNDNTGINVTSPTSQLHTTSFATGYVSKAANYTLTINDETVEVTASSVTITLPTAIGITGREYTIKLTANTTSTVATTSSQTIDGSTTYSLSAQYKYVRVKSNGSNWIIIANN